MIFKYDLHSHSTASDGDLKPTELLVRAKAQGVDTLALTDHDTLDGLEEAMATAKLIDLDFITGIELSTTWRNRCFHLVGLNIAPNSAVLQQGVEEQQHLRRLRTEKMALKLEKKGIKGAYEAVMKVTGKGMVTRSHFASFLVKEGHVANMQAAFTRYLGDGKPAFVPTNWISLIEAVHWIKEAGGVAVLAHPLRYRITASWMRRLLAEFKEMGGAGLEVVTGRSSAEDIRLSYNYAKKFELAGSTGSDFHSPHNQWVELGRFPDLPDDIKPIWELFK
ncbi:MAG: PHP domain-containing protein [Methylococcales bacterium]|nr:PHP domain-containing protein [Methylococcales bacterium]